MLKRIIVVMFIGTSVLAPSRLSIVRAADNPLLGAWAGHECQRTGAVWTLTRVE